MHINDAKHLALGGVGQVNDLEHASLGGSGALDDLQKEAYAPNTHINDGLYADAGGPPGHISDLLYDKWAGGGGGGVEFASHSFTGNGGNLVSSSRFGYQFTVLNENLICNDLRLYGAFSDVTQNVRVHRVSDGALMAEADILSVGLQWVIVKVGNYTLDVGADYTVSYRYIPGDRTLNRGQTGVTFYSGINKTQNVFGTGDDLPTSTSANLYGESGFGYSN